MLARVGRIIRIANRPAQRAAPVVVWGDGGHFAVEQQIPRCARDDEGF